MKVKKELVKSNIQLDMFSVNQLNNIKYEIMLNVFSHEEESEEGKIYVYNGSHLTCDVKKRDEAIVALIRLKYDVNQEFSLLNRGILNKNDVDYIAYRDFVLLCKAKVDEYFSDFKNK